MRCKTSRRQWLAAALAAGVPLTSIAQKASLRPPRLITVSGAITEVVYALGAEDQLVGTDTSSLFPAAALKTPKVGYLRQLSAEGVLSLRPDVVIATSEAGPPVVLDQLRGAGVQIELVKSAYTWNDVAAKVRAVGLAARREAAARELQARLEAEWAQVTQQIGSDKRPKPRVLFMFSPGPPPQVAGQGTAADAMIRFAGGTNALTGFQGYRPMTAEAMASAAPDVVLTTEQGLEALGGPEKFWQRPELALTPAYRRRALVSQDALLLLGFGPRLPMAVRELHRRLHA
ncbi:MAG: ABC transporter substrate-binding protein [Ottowia sp.]|nr:ABC transporter substrate-binding protein [Ottowia sp.]